MTDPTPLIFGPAYLDRVVRVDRRLVDPSFGERPLDGSVDGAWLGPGEGLELVDPLGNRLAVGLPPDWPGPTGRVGLSRPLSPAKAGWSRRVESTGWRDDLGGMGAGYAAALGGELVCALGPGSDPTSRAVAGLLDAQGIRQRAIRVDRPADWTLLISSGEHGDKLPIGFRGCHAALADLGPAADRFAPLRLAAALPNRLAGRALRGPAAIRAFAPALRNMLDRDPPLLDFLDWVDVLSCNRGEWESLADRDEVAGRVALLVVTDGPAGATLRYTTPKGEAGRIEIPAFPRSRPPRDTNRAGEAFASALLSTLMAGGWTPGPIDPNLLGIAAERGSAAAALVLDRVDFGFPTDDEVDRAVRAGRVD